MNYTLWNEECLSAMERIPDGSVDMVMCDLPYGTTQNKWDSVIDLPTLWAAYRRVCKPSAAIVLTAAQPFTSVLVCSNLKEFKYDWVWQKERGTGHLNAKKAPLRDKEDVLVFCQTTPLYLPQMKLGEPYKDKCGKNKSANFGADKREGNDNSGFRYPTTVLNFQGSSSKDKVHPTQKPVALMEYLIKTYTNEGELVLDNTMGSGTTGVACGNLGRKFIGIEQDEKYFKIAQSRISAAYPNDDFC